MKADIHPDLRLEARFALLTSTVTIIGGAFLFSFGLLLLAILTGTLPGTAVFESPPPLIGWLIVSTCFLVGVLLMLFGRHLMTTYLHRLRKVSWLLSHTQPRRMTMTFADVRGAPGRLVELREEGWSGTGRTAERIDLRSPQWKLNDFRSQSVDVYTDPDPEGVVAILTRGGVLWGYREETGSFHSIPD